MATFRSGFKIIGELTLRQSLGRIRSYSEDRKPGSWLPEDQWAVRPPCTTCPDPCTPKKPKASKSWLSICTDPEPPLPCDIRHNNCPPPKTDDEPWYAFITKKKPEKPKPPLEACREELRRQAEMPDEEETCENLGDTGWPEYTPPCPPCPPEEPICKERQPAPVIRLSCPPPKELDLMLWCGRPGLSVARIASQCQSDRMPYEEFRPRKCWKPPPYSLPCKSEAPAHQPFCCNVGRAPLAEFKQVEIPKPVYTRYKSVELEDENFLLCMTDARCPPDDCGPSLALEPPPIKKAKPPPEEPKQEPCPEKPVLVAASRKPVKLRCAPKYKFRPKPTKLIEKRPCRNPCAHHKACDLTRIQPLEEEKPCEPIWNPPCIGDPPKVITSNVTDEPATYERSIPSKKPPLWMFVVSKPGSNDTPLVPHLTRYPKEPDWCGETDGLKFYDEENEGICPKPPPDPCKEGGEPPPPPPPPPPCPCPEKPQRKIVSPPVPEDEKFVLMPEKYNIRNLRPPEDKAKKDLSEATFQQFIEAKTANLKKCSKLYPQMKESILYDFVRNCPLPPMDPSKPDPPPRKPPEPECPQPIRFYYRRYSTFAPFKKPNYAKYLNRTMSEDSKEKCKARKLVPKPKECPVPVKGPSCEEMTLPCCPKAKIPPRCDVKKKMPACKKKAAPKPSYSECSKDPPPHPRITECNAWEKREMENQKKGSSKGRKFSSWAPEEGYCRDNQNAKIHSTDPSTPSKTASDSEQLELKESRKREDKRLPHIRRNVFPGKQIMLNFMSTTEDSYYTSDSLVKKRKTQPWTKLKTILPEETKVDGNQMHERKVITLLLQDHHTRNDANARNLRISHRESGLGVYVDGTSPRNPFASIANWIKRFLKTRGKRARSAPPSLTRMDKTPAESYVETVDVDRIMKLTKPFRDRTKDDDVSYYTIDPLNGNNGERKVPLPLRKLWGRQWNKSLVLFPRLNKEKAQSSMWKLEAISPTVDAKPDNDSLNPVKLLQASPEKPSRLPAGKSEEYPVAVMEKLSGGDLLANKKQNPKNIQFFLGGKNGFRCYTAPVTTSRRKSLTFPMEITPNIPKKEVTPKTDSVVFIQSATSTVVMNMLAKRKCPPKINRTSLPQSIFLIALPPKPCLEGYEGDISVKSKRKKWNEDMGYWAEKETKKKSSNENLKYNSDKHLKRKGVKTLLEKRKNILKIQTSGKTRQFSKYFVNKNKERNTMDRKGCGEGGEMSKSSPLNTGMPKELSNNIELYDTDLEIIEYVDGHPESRERVMQTKRNSNELISSGSYEKLHYVDRWDKYPRKPYEHVMHARKFAKVSEKPTNKSNKTWKRDCRDSDHGTHKRQKPVCGSNQNSNTNSNNNNNNNNNNNKEKDEINASCKTFVHKKPGPNCPDG